MFLERTERQIIPRWRDFVTTAQLGELDSLNRSQRNLPAGWTIGDKRSEWLKHRTVWHAADFLGTALVIGKPQEAYDAAQFLLEHAGNAPRPAVLLARHVVGPSDGPEDLGAHLEFESADAIYKRVHQLRRVVHEQTRNSIAWIELARSYTLIGEIERANRAIRIACNIDPDNRFVLRSAVRFLVHVREPIKAHRVLRRSALTQHDPWLLAAEIAVSSLTNLPPLYGKRARSTIEDGDFSNFSKTELASALGTMELSSGNARAAKNLFRQSLADPTENSVAQAEWAAPQLGLNVDVETFHTPRSFEAKAWSAYNRADWNTAIHHAEDWFLDQPFSSRASSFASYLNSIAERHETSVVILNSSLKANPRDRMLTNNLAFALASSGDVEGANRVLSGVDERMHGDSTDITILATRGLISFRKGSIEEGRNLYLRAMELAKQYSIDKYYIHAALYLAREEILAGTEHASAATLRGMEAARNRTEPDTLLIATKILELAMSEQSHLPEAPKKAAL